MFIVAWLVILVIDANHWLNIPHIVSIIVGIIAALEVLTYIVAILLQIGMLGYFIKERRGK